MAQVNQKTITARLEFRGGDSFNKDFQMTAPFDVDRAIAEIKRAMGGDGKLLTLWCALEIQENGAYLSGARCNLHYVIESQILDDNRAKVDDLPAGVFVWPYIAPDDTHPDYPGWIVKNPRWKEYPQNRLVWVHTGQGVELSLVNIIDEPAALEILGRFLRMVAARDFDPATDDFAIAKQGLEWVKAD